MSTYLIVSPLVTLHDELVSSGDEHQAVGVVKLLRDVLAKPQPTQHTQQVCIYVC